jgi:serine/threonine-protein kinase
MMYELVTGLPAWQRPSVVAVAAARLLSPPPDPRAVASDVPEALAAVVLHLMARQRDDRPRNALEVVEALSAVDAAIPPQDRPSAVPRISDDRRKKTVAVLPLEVVTEDLWLAYGIVDELTGILARSDGLMVRDPPPLMSALDRDGRELGRILDVDAVVTGLVRREEEEGVRVTLRLTTVEDGFQLWVQTFTRPIAEIGLISDKAASAIAEMLSTRVIIPPREVVTGTVEERLLKGRYALYRAIGGFRDQSAAILREAHAAAPNDARVTGAFAISLARAYRAEETAESAEARKIALRALELDATRPEGRIALGTIHLADGEPEKAAIEIASALRVAPNSIDALDTMGRVLAEAGAAEEGIRLVDRVLQKQEIVLARHMRIRTRLLVGDWDRLFEWMSELPKDASSIPALALLWARALTWCPDDEQAKAIGRMIMGLQLRGPASDTAARIGEDPRSPTGRAAIRDVLAFAHDVMPSHNPRARALRAQLAVEAALYVGDMPGAVAAFREADEAKLFDRHWLDRCHLLEPLRAAPELAAARANVTRRAQAIVTAYERARISSRARV